MAIRFQCPNCKAIRTANERLLGRQIKCPECGAPVSMPTLEQVESARKAQKAAADKANRQETEPQKAPAPTPIQSRLADVDAEPGDPLSFEDRLAQQERELAAVAMRFTRPRGPAKDDMDMTPMVDVTFLLLIFFMITASFSVQKSIQRPAQRRDEPSLSTVQQPEEENPDVVTVQVDEFNAYNVITTNWDRVAGSKQDLIVALNEAHIGNTGQQPTKLVVQAHEDCIHGAVIAVLDAGREAQFESFEVTTVEQFD